MPVFAPLSWGAKLISQPVSRFYLSSIGCQSETARVQEGGRKRQTDLGWTRFPYIQCISSPQSSFISQSGSRHQCIQVTFSAISI